MNKSDKLEPVELDIPDGVQTSDRAAEVLRAWIADGTLMLSLNADAFDDRVADWGRLLAEIAQHIARAAALQGKMAEHEAIQELRKGFDATIIRGQPAMTGTMRGRINH